MPPRKNWPGRGSGGGLPIKLRRLPTQLKQWFRGLYVSQVVGEVLVQKTSTARQSQVSDEVVVQKTSVARQSQVAVEVLQQTHHNALVSQVAVEVLRPVKMIQPGFHGTSSITFTVRKLHRTTVTFAGKGTFTAGVTTGHGVTRNFNLTLAGTSSLSAKITQTDYITPTFAGQGQLLFGIGPIDLSPVVFSGTSSFLALFKIHVTFAGKSTLSFNLHRAQFPFEIHGLGSLTFTQDLGPNGARLSQLTNEVAYVGTNTPVELSQLTLEVARPRTGLHIWTKF